jgi:IS66 Orf2 like protein
VIPVPSGVRVWLAAGHTDMRRGMNGLALQVQQALGRDPHAGDLYVFRGRRGDLIKIVWHDGIGMSLYAQEAGAWPVHLALAGGRRGGDLGVPARLYAGRHRLAEPAADMAAGSRRVGLHIRTSRLPAARRI